MKKYILGMIMAVFAFIAVLPHSIDASENQGIELKPDKNKAEVILTMPQFAAEKVSSLQLSLDITTNTSAADVSFKFNSNLPAKVKEYRYHEDTHMLNLYIAGTTPLFDKDSLSLGEVIADTTDGSGLTAYVNVKIDSLKYVSGTKIATVKNQLSYPETVTLTAGDGGEPINKPTPEVPGTTAPAGEQPAPGTTDQEQETKIPAATDQLKLRDVLSIANGYAEEDYTAESYSILKEAIRKAEELLNKPDVTQKEIDDAVMLVQNAIGALIKKSDAAAKNTGSPTVSSVNADKSAKTGDSNSIVLMLALAAASLSVIAVCFKRRNTNNKEID